MSSNAEAIAALDEEIADIEQVLSIGASETIVAGEKVKYDLPHLARRVQQLKQRKAKLESASATAIDPFTPIDMSGG